MGSFLLKILKHFSYSANKKILFVSYSGNQFSDSPRVLYESLCKDSRFDDFELIWAFRHPEKIQISGRGTKIKIDSLSYYKVALTSQVWITNVSVERGLSFKGKNTLYFCTWHGSTVKKLWHDVPKHNSKEFIPINAVSFDILCAQSDYDIDVFSRAFKINRSCIMKTGLPRNDYLVHVNQNEREKIRNSLHIREEHIVILYAPTFRSYKINSAIITPSLWEKALDDQYIVLYKGHHFANKIKGQKDSSRFRNVSSNQDIRPLMIACDILISDYSSVFFDFSILEKPMLCYAPDLERYEKERGLYVDLEKFLPKDTVFQNELSLIYAIRECDTKQRRIEIRKFKEKYVQESGGASAKCIDLIAKQFIQ